MNPSLRTRLAQGRVGNISWQCAGEHLIIAHVKLKDCGLGANQRLPSLGPALQVHDCEGPVPWGR
eukprot:700117-Alexandrium_andersonii.AAC.1